MSSFICSVIVFTLYYFSTAIIVLALSAITKAWVLGYFFAFLLLCGYLYGLSEMCENRRD